MNVREKLAVLADSAKYDASCASSGSKGTRQGSRLGTTEGMGICHSYTPDGRCVSLLKILLTNFCVYDCRYCVNRASSDIPRAKFTPEEVVDLTLEFYRRNYIEGLFLSSGIFRSPDHTMERLVAVARTLRTVHRFGGYVHLKVIPGCSAELLEQAGRFADRLSANIELPTEPDLVQLAPEKNRPEIESAMTTLKGGIAQARADRSRHAPRFAPAGQSTQMIVGATPTPDREILATASDLYGAHRLRRVYYSAFSPIPDSSADLPPIRPPLVREHRLYQADWLLRFYGFAADELATEADGNLSLEIDPKTAWALAHRERFPIDVNAADREELLRVPGIGVRNVKRILSIRRHRRLRVADLKRLRVAWKRSAPFVVCVDHDPAVRLLDADGLRRRVTPERQLTLFDTAAPARSGEL